MSTFLFLNQVHWNISHTTLSTRRTADGARGECFNINFELIPNIPWPSFPLETQARGQDGCTVQLANDDVRCVEYVRSVTLIDLIALGTISVSSWNGHHLFRLPLVRANIDMVRNIEVQRGGRDEITNTSPSPRVRDDVWTWSVLTFVCVAVGRFYGEVNRTLCCHDFNGHDSISWGKASYGLFPMFLGPLFHALASLHVTTTEGHTHTLNVVVFDRRNKWESHPPRDTRNCSVNRSANISCTKL